MAPNACAVEWMSIVCVEPADQSCGVTVFPPFSGIGTGTAAHPFSNDMERSQPIPRGIGTTSTPRMNTETVTESVLLGKSLKILNSSFANKTELEAMQRVLTFVMDVAHSADDLWIQLQPSVPHHPGCFNHDPHQHY